MSAYSEASKAVYEVFDDTTPLVEGMSIDEAFLDVRGLRRVSGTPTEIAARLRREVREPGRAADHGRDRADEVPRQGRERRGQARRPAARAARRRDRVPPPAARRAAVGSRPGDGEEAARPRDHDRRRGRAVRRDGARRAARPRLRPAPPRARTQPRSPAGAGPAAAAGRWARSARSAAGRPRSPTLDASLVGLVDRVTRRMRTARRAGRTVVLRLRFDDFSRATRSHTLPYADREHRRRSSDRREACSPRPCR